MNKTKNDKAWEILFKQHEILSYLETHPYFEIEASQINTRRQARLMAKFDHRFNLPQIFSENKLAILPITRGDYIISRFEAFHNLPESIYNSSIIPVKFPEHITSIDRNHITSEATAINCAYITGILQDFAEEDYLIPTISGRMSSSAFSFTVLNSKTKLLMPINIDRVQIEIDGGYEGPNKLILIEAKNSMPEDFIIRQLYFPFRLWQNKLNKTVIPVFMTYSNGVFSLYEYAFEDSENYNSIKLVKQKHYTFEKMHVTLDDIMKTLKKVKPLKETNNVPFPQADNFKRIINLCELLKNNKQTKNDITENYEFDPRQTDYYINAAKYLGLVKDSGDKKNLTSFELTSVGSKLIQSPYKIRQLELVKLILKHKPFHETLKKCLKNDKMPTKKEIVDIMKKIKISNIHADTTFERRTSTVKNWINWILELQNYP